MDPNVTQYGLWSVALLNAAIFILFAFSFSKPSTLRDWRSFGAKPICKGAHPAHGSRGSGGGMVRRMRTLPRHPLDRGADVVDHLSQQVGALGLAHHPDHRLGA